MASRRWNFLGALACAGLLGYAYYSQYVLHLDPCPLCIFQRIGVFATGVVFLVAALHGPRRGGRRVYAVLLGLTVLATVAVAVRQLYIQSLPPGTIPACGASLDIMMRFMPMREVLAKVLTGSGECAKVDWRLFGLAMPAWVAMSSLALGAFGIWANTRSLRPVLRF